MSPSFRYRELAEVLGRRWAERRKAGPTFWTIDRVRDVPPTAGSECYAAYAFHFVGADDPHEPQMVVEYTSGGTHASKQHARQVVQPYLDADTPPRRIVVDRDGNARPSQ
jgi:hypothetical protein